MGSPREKRPKSRNDYASISQAIDKRIAALNTLIESSTTNKSSVAHNTALQNIAG